MKELFHVIGNSSTELTNLYEITSDFPSADLFHFDSDIHTYQWDILGTLFLPKVNVIVKHLWQSVSLILKWTLTDVSTGHSPRLVCERRFTWTKDHVIELHADIKHVYYQGYVNIYIYIYEDFVDMSRVKFIFTEIIDNFVHQNICSVLVENLHAISYTSNAFKLLYKSL